MVGNGEGGESADERQITLVLTKTRVVRSKQVKNDLEEFWIYIAEDNVDAAEALMDRSCGTMSGGDLMLEQ